MKENKIIKGIIWGTSTMIGFILADAIYKIGIDAVNKEKKQEEIIDMIEVEESE